MASRTYVSVRGAPTEAVAATRVDVDLDQCTAGGTGSFVCYLICHAALRPCRNYWAVTWKERSMIAFRLPVSSLGGALIALTASSGAGRAALTEDNFISKTTGDLSALCSAAPTDKLYTAAVNFCYGFGAGVYGILAAAQQADPKLKLFCAPPEVTRNEAVTAFIAWAGGKPERVSLPAVDGITKFLTETYPCKNTATDATTRRAK
jgi:hypothetical protein